MLSFRGDPASFNGAPAVLPPLSFGIRRPVACDVRAAATIHSNEANLRDTCVRQIQRGEGGLIAPNKS